jgi:hypothetical protein
MREVRDAAMRERAVKIVETVGSIAFEIASKSSKEKPRYFRGALVKPR